MADNTWVGFGGEASVDPRPRQAQTAVVPDPRWDPHGDKIRAQQAARAEGARRERQATEEIMKAYPRAGQPIKIRMIVGSVGHVSETGFNHALEAIQCGRAELVRPNGTTWRVK